MADSERGHRVAFVDRYTLKHGFASELSVARAPEHSVLRTGVAKPPTEDLNADSHYLLSRPDLSTMTSEEMRRAAEEYDHAAQAAIDVGWKRDRSAPVDHADASTRLRRRQPD